MSGDLSALVARLEAVTTRLEAAADKSGGAPEGELWSSLRFSEHGTKGRRLRFFVFQPTDGDMYYPLVIV